MIRTGGLFWGRWVKYARRGTHTARGGKELKRRRNADPGKVQMARWLRKETTMNRGWIAGLLVMGAAGDAAACVRELLEQS